MYIYIYTYIYIYIYAYTYIQKCSGFAKLSWYKLQRKDWVVVFQICGARFFADNRNRLFKPGWLSN